MTILDRPLRRQIDIDGAPWVVTITPDGARLVPKGKRNGIEITWASIVTGEQALHAQLARSLAETPAAAPPSEPPATSKRTARALTKDRKHAPATPRLAR